MIQNRLNVEESSSVRLYLILYYVIDGKTQTGSMENF